MRYSFQALSEYAKTFGIHEIQKESFDRQCQCTDCHDDCGVLATHCIPVHYRENIALCDYAISEISTHGLQSHFQSGSVSVNTIMHEAFIQTDATADERAATNAVVADAVSLVAEVIEEKRREDIVSR